jgi:hypothetical protein
MREFPSQYGRSEQYRNPEGTLPFPAAKEIPRPVWTQPRIGVTFTGTLVFPPINPASGYLYTGAWESPWYDLRPDLRSSESQPKLGVPIWERSARLYVALSGGNNAFVPGYNVNGKTATLTQFFEPVSLDPGQTIAAAPGGNAAVPPPPPNPNLVVPSAPVNVSSTFFPALPVGTGNVQSTLGVFSPPGTFSGQGEGYPVRFWRIRLVFTQFSPDPNPVLPVPDPETLQIQAAYY